MIIRSKFPEKLTPELDSKGLRTLLICIVCIATAIESMFIIGSALNHDRQIGIIGGADGPTTIVLDGQKKDLLLSHLIEVLMGKTESNLQGPEKNGAAGMEEKVNEATEEQRKEALEKGLLVLINKQNPVEETFKPDDLAPIKYFAPDRSVAGRYMRTEAADQFHRLIEAAALEGHTLVMTTAYRSYGFQQVLWNNYKATYGIEAASRFSARPGESEHQSGLAADVSAPSVDYELTDSFGETPEGLWLAENAHRFGFIIRYPKSKEEITGYLYEPWHIRYVGEAVAGEIFGKNITLEEYLNQ